MRQNSEELKQIRLVVLKIWGKKNIDLVNNCVSGARN